MAGSSSSQPFVCQTCSLFPDCFHDPDCPRFTEDSPFDPFPATGEDIDPSLPPQAAARALHKLCYDVVYERILHCTGSKTEAEAAAALGVEPSEIARARQELRLPEKWFLRLYFERRVSFCWLLTGRGPEFLRRTPARGSRRGRSMEHAIWYAICLYEEALSARRALVSLSRMIASWDKENPEWRTGAGERKEER